MRQLVQDPRAGTVRVVEVPSPALRPRTILVRNAFSAISPGTERGTVAAARDSYLKTARARPDLVRRVLDTVKREGIVAAYAKVQAKLSEPKALGYSSAGVVVEIGPGAGDTFRVGDRVACCGQGIASHAEVIRVPVNLAARVPDDVSLEDAAFATLGAISLHGVRLLEPQFGGRYAVIGLGILGLLAVQFLRAHGCRVAAFDLDEALVARGLALGAAPSVSGGTDEQVLTALSWTEGLGVDGVIVTASSRSDAPMVAAAGMCRERARVVAVGLVPFGLPREIAYAKELELRISRSYGPGRYDAGFEEKGLDYPAGYVRWTETRNLEAFLSAVAAGQVAVGPLVSHRFPLEEAPGAYDLLLDPKGPRPVGMLIRYPEGASPAVASGETGAAVRRGPAPPADDRAGTAFIGAGAFARGVLLPRFAGRKDVSLLRVVTSQGLTALDAQRRFGFASSGTDVDEALRDPAVQLVCIATRHDLHADLVVRALRAGKHVFVEKPLALDDEELRRVEQEAAGAPGILVVGFNRRFAPLAGRVRAAFAGRGPLLMICRVNAGSLPRGHWLNDPEVGGGRIVGEGCHFVDLLSFFAGDPGITRVQTMGAGRSEGPSESVAAQISFGDGSVGQILYAAAGDPSAGKERIELHGGGVSAVIEDWRSAVIRSAGRKRKLAGRGKGHAEEIDAVIRAVRAAGDPPIALRTLVEVTRATFRIRDGVARD